MRLKPLILGLMAWRATEKVLVTGGAGFTGSHVAEYYAKRGKEAVAFDNLSRAEILEKSVGDPLYNWKIR